MKTVNQLTAKEKFKVLYRDEFQCQYCGDRPGSEQLVVDHLIPRSRMGSDFEGNLITACRKCNRGKSDNILVPHKMIQGMDSDGWSILKTWGAWSIRFSKTECYVVGYVYGNGAEYPFDILRSHETDWENHISKKTWREPHKFSDFIQCLDYARELVISPKEIEEDWNG